MGFGIRIFPGVRISASSRGIRAGIGPRAARVHVGSGRAGFSSGIGPVTYYTGGGGRRRTPTSKRATYERESQLAMHSADFDLVAKADVALGALMDACIEEFPASQPPIIADPEPVTRMCWSRLPRREP